MVFEKLSVHIQKVYPMEWLRLETITLIIPAKEGVRCLTASIQRSCANP
jgi:hypothetical protein